MAELTVPERLLARVAAHAERAHPEECCGILVGGDSAGGPPGVERHRGERHRGERRVERVVEADNAAADRTRRYAIPPEALLAAHKEARREGREVVGYYHSHPHGPAVPSAYDLEHAWPGTSYLIVELNDAKVAAVKSFRLSSDGGRFEEERLVARDEQALR